MAADGKPSPGTPRSQRVQQVPFTNLPTWIKDALDTQDDSFPAHLGVGQIVPVLDAFQGGWGTGTLCVISASVEGPTAGDNAGDLDVRGGIAPGEAVVIFGASVQVTGRAATTDVQLELGNRSVEFDYSPTDDINKLLDALPSPPEAPDAAR